MNISNLLNNETFEQDFYAFSTSPTRPVVVKWGGSGIHEITGPTPFLDISKSFNTNEAGVVESIVHTINLTGKIFSTGLAGIGPITTGIAKLDNLFKNCAVSTLEIFCDNTLLWSASGVQVKGISFNKTDDNWVRSADYSVDLEYKTGPSNDPDDQVEERNDSWSIEPLDDIVYTKFRQLVDQKPEFHNPKMKPRAPTISTPVPAQSVGGGNFNNTENTIQFFSIPQFRVSRRLSARGLMTPPPSGGSACLDANRAKTEEKKFFLNAKAWVDKQTKLAFNGSQATGSIFFTTNPNQVFDYNGTWLYNHNRTINADIYNATYEVNDTWIALPTGIPYIETFNIEVSTDSSNTKTVRVAGNIQGLSITPRHITVDGKGPFPSGTGALVSPMSPAASGSMRLDLSYTMENPPIVPLNPRYNIPSVAGGGIGLLDTGGTPSEITQIDSIKYTNALNAWTKDIKPYLYRRACIGINSNDRTQPTPPPPPQQPPRPPQNHIFLTENLLNVIPTTTSEGHDPIKGTISYSHEFDNKLLTISGVLSENINISNTAPAYSIQETQILGRALGPILYAAGVTNPRKSINIDIVVPKGTGLKAQFMTDPACPLYVSGFFWKTVDTLVNGHAPFANRTIAFFENTPSQLFGTVFRDSDSEQWNPTEGRYSRNVSWIYQQCTTDKLYFDH